MAAGTIPTDYVVLASAFLSVLIVYLSRINGLESEFDRERHLNYRLQDGTWFSNGWGITVDSIQVYEDSGFLYRVKKFFTGSLSGKVVVLVRYEYEGFSESFWESGKGEELLEEWSGEVEHLGTHENIRPIGARFEFCSLDDGDITDFFTMLVEADKKGVISPDVSSSNTS